MAVPPRASAPSLIVGIDTGGTFTYVTLIDPPTGRVWTAKTPSTRPRRPSKPRTSRRSPLCSAQLR